MLIRLFKRMKDYIIENKVLIDDVDIVKVAIQSNQNKQEIQPDILCFFLFTLVIFAKTENGFY